MFVNHNDYPCPGSRNTTDSGCRDSIAGKTIYASDDAASSGEATIPNTASALRP